LNNGRSHPPAAAVWFLRRLCPKRNREAITDDLLERFCEEALQRMVLASSSGSNRYWSFERIETALDGNLPRCSSHGPHLAYSVGLIFPISAMTTSMNWPARLQWLVVIQIVTALTVLPLFAVLFSIWMTFRWANLLGVFFTCAMLLTVGDLPIIWWSVSHPVMSGSQQGALVVALQLVWIFATLLISARVARHLPFPSKTIPT
jgi:hypothetical protein